MTIVLLAIVTVSVYTVVLQHLDRVQAYRVARDLSHLRLGIRMFDGNTAVFPRYITHLSNPVTTSDSTVSEAEYDVRQVARWNGPYTDLHLDPDLRIFLNHADCLNDPDVCQDAVAWRTGWDRRIQNLFECFDPATQYTVIPCQSGNWVVIRIDGMTAPEFELVNDIMDGEAEPDTTVNWLDPLTNTTQTVVQAWIEGKLRFVLSDGININSTVGVVYYMAAPFVQ